MNFSELVKEASSVINIEAAIIAAGIALLAGLAIVLKRHGRLMK